MTSATERLRALLDERGVEWMPSVFDPPRETFYEVNGVGFIVTEFPEIQRMSLACDMRITPEQAVAATLGPGTCRDVAEFRGFGTKTEFRCSECGYEYSAVGGFGCDYGDEPDFRYCPNCGRKVVE